MEPRTLFESGDVARALDVGSARTRELIRSGAIRPVATTPRGCKLFDPSDVEALRQRRQQERRAVR